MSFDDNKEVNARMREELGKKFHKTEYDYTSFLKYCAKAGDVQEQYLLGLSYARGFGCVKNTSRNLHPMNSLSSVAICKACMAAPPPCMPIGNLALNGTKA